KVVAERGDDGVARPFGAPCELVKARRGLEDLAHALPGLLSGETGEGAERGLVGGVGEEVVAEDAGEALLVHGGREDEEDEVAFWAFAAPERTVVAVVAEVAVAAREHVVEARGLREEPRDAGFGEGPQQREVVKRAAGGAAQNEIGRAHV